MGKGNFGIALYLLLFFFPGTILSQVTRVRGTVTDERTGEAIPFVNIIVQGTTIGAATDFEGRYKLEFTGDFTRIQISNLGYITSVRTIIPGKENTVNVRLEKQARELKEVVIKAGRDRYKNKENPAVELIRKVIAQKDSNRFSKIDYAQYERYEKIQFALSNISEKFKSQRALKKFQFVFNNIDTTKIKGEEVLPVFLKETLSDFKLRKSPKKTKEFIKATKTVSFDEYLDRDGLTNYFKYLYQEINIYDNYINLLTNQFVSPIANSAPTFYKYFITDSLIVDGVPCIELSFVPRNHVDMLFKGAMYITRDGSFAVRKIDMTIDEAINLNWVKELKIVQNFEPINNRWLISKDEFLADFGSNLVKTGVFGQRLVSYKKIEINKPLPDSVYEGLETVRLAEADSLPEEFWVEKRHQDLTQNEQNTYITIDSVKHVPIFRKTMDFIFVLITGYRKLGPFEVGPLNTFYSFNPVEGFRLRFGGRTSNAFSKKVNVDCYAAYGFTDERWKYKLGVTYSFSKRSIFEFPIKSLNVSYEYRTRTPGQELQFVQDDNFLLSFRRGTNDKWLYNKTYSAEWLNEYRNNFSHSIGFKFLAMEPASNLRFSRVSYTNDSITNFTNLQTSEFSISLRYAKGEKFYQGKTYRTPISNRNPVLRLRYVIGVKGLFGAEYQYHNLTASISKRFIISPIGYTDVLLEAGKIFGTVPYPLLTMHRANQNYSYQKMSYNLMNYLEFVSDEYASMNIDHWFNGFVFNKIPLIRRLKWREVVTFKILYGSLSRKNNPDHNPELYKFPTLADGTPTTFTLQAKPYMEGSIGIANVFKFFRIDLVQRFSYLNHPGVSALGIRVKFQFDF
jgi:hypothetical protein